MGHELIDSIDFAAGDGLFCFECLWFEFVFVGSMDLVFLLHLRGSEPVLDEKNMTEQHLTMKQKAAIVTFVLLPPVIPLYFAFTTDDPTIKMICFAAAIGLFLTNLVASFLLINWLFKNG